MYEESLKLTARCVRHSHCFQTAETAQHLLVFVAYHFALLLPSSYGTIQYKMLYIQANLQVFVVL